MPVPVSAPMASSFFLVAGGGLSIKTVVGAAVVADRGGPVGSAPTAIPAAEEGNAAKASHGVASLLGRTSPGGGGRRSGSHRRLAAAGIDVDDGENILHTDPSNGSSIS